MDNHTSVLGIREYAKQAGGFFSVVDGDLKCSCSKDLAAAAERHQRSNADVTTEACHLFAFPAESNFSGFKYPLDWVQRVQRDGVGHSQCRQGNWKVLLDTTKFCANDTLDLACVPADFVTLSFYKLFGYPTGLGCLVVKNDVAALMRKNSYFGGGTVDASASNSDFVVARQHSDKVYEKFEDGTVPFTSVAALPYGFDCLEKQLSLAGIRKHVTALTSFTVAELAALRHFNGQPVCEVYGHDTSQFNASPKPGDEDTQASPYCTPHGPIVTFNLFWPCGDYVGYAEVEKLSAAANIQLRTGCFCNIGACQIYLSLTAEDIQANLAAGHSCGDDKDIVNGRPTGAVRASFGYMSSFEDASTFLRFIRQQFMNSARVSEPVPHSISVQDVAVAPLIPPSVATPSLSHIFIYPIKSCAAVSVSKWRTAADGLQFDRLWALVDRFGVALTQKKIPKMCLIQPALDLEAQTMTVTAPGMEMPLVVEIGQAAQLTHSTGSTSQVKVSSSVCSDFTVCGSKRQGSVYAEDVSGWFSDFLGIDCHLALIETSQEQDKLEKVGSSIQPLPSIGFKNDGQYLMINSASVRSVLRDNLARFDNQLSEEEGDRSCQQPQTSEEKAQEDELCFEYSSRFRPNFVVAGLNAFVEDSWTRVKIGSSLFKVSGPCQRCVMVNVDPTTGNSRHTLFSTLAMSRRTKHGRKITFGVLLQRATDDESKDSDPSEGSKAHSRPDQGDSALIEVGLQVHPS
eukprot:CAMPEP_0175126612 /NCGR_PEP_ID=MMETSP0087-20121206/3950_1 /TAXON_ID=136419 /ORGANISM="Unknown Unknown, Strain D1" /LENGTH=740 /DNA_ID=CAMNT_0016408543 /DNA_START=37 /DNA_END=2259 /DNA_ORIENTATION=-